MAKIDLPYGAWRGGRPRFIPGARERAMGFKGKDLKHDDGRWFDLGEAHAFLIAMRDEIRTQRKTGRKLKSPPVARTRKVSDLWNAYVASDKFKSFTPSSQASYKRFVRPLVEEPIWHAPVASLDPVILKALHEKIKAERGQAMANAVLRVLAGALSWGRLHGWSPRNRDGAIADSPARRLDLAGTPPRLRVASDLEIRALVDASDRVIYRGVALSAVGDAILTGLFSGQRKKDVLAFIPGEQSNSRIELVQSKTKARVSIPMAPRLVERIAAGRARRARADYRVVSSNIVINEGIGLPYAGSTFAEHFREVRNEAKKTCASVADFTFPDLRDTAVTWYARAGCTIPEIASITGHSLASIYNILKHYLALDAELADNAVKKLVDYMDREGMAV